MRVKAIHKHGGLSGGKEYAGDNKSPAHDGRADSTPTSAPFKISYSSGTVHLRCFLWQKKV